MDQLERIDNEDVPIAYIIKVEMKPDKTTFLTPSDFNLQLGFVVYPEGGAVTPHVHRPVERKIIGTSEVLLVKKGQCEIDIYNSKRELVATRQLQEGDLGVDRRDDRPCRQRLPRVECDPDDAALPDLDAPDIGARADHAAEGRQPSRERKRQAARAATRVPHTGLVVGRLPDRIERAAGLVGADRGVRGQRSDRRPQPFAGQIFVQQPAVRRGQRRGQSGGTEPAQHAREVQGLAGQRLQPVGAAGGSHHFQRRGDQRLQRAHEASVGAGLG